MSLQAMIFWIRIFAVITAISTTWVPLLYAFYPWRTTRMGRVFMFQAVAFAIAMDTSTVFSFWKPKTLWYIFVADVVILALITASTSALAFHMWRLNRPKKRGRHAKR